MHRESFSVSRGFDPLLHDEKCGGYGASRVAYYASQGSNEVRRVFARRTSSSGRQTSAYHDGLAHDVDACYG